MKKDKALKHIVEIFSEDIDESLDEARRGILIKVENFIERLHISFSRDAKFIEISSALSDASAEKEQLYGLARTEAAIEKELNPAPHRDVLWKESFHDWMTDEIETMGKWNVGGIGGLEKLAAALEKQAARIRKEIEDIKSIP